MNPEVFEYKTLKINGKIVFSKLVMSEFDRIDKRFKEDEACFMFINEGHFTVRTPNKIVSINKGESFLAKCGNYFFEIEKYNPKLNKKLTFVAAYFYPEIIQELFNQNIFTTNKVQNFDAKKITIDKLMTNFMDNISFLLDNQEITDEELVKTKIKELLILLSKAENTKVIDYISSLFEPYEYKFRTIIKENLYSNLSLEEFSFLCGMSLATFKRKFSKIYTESPRKYFSKMKMEKAVKMLTFQDNRITQIAYDCGYDSVTTFNRNFKKEFGKSPSEYRKF